MNPIRQYTRCLLEKQQRVQKSKRILYHIGPRPAAPKPLSRPGEFGWRRYWLDQDVESGVFFSPNPFDIAQYHGVDGNVYTYKIPEWVIAKAGGVHRYDHGSEILISSDVWEEAGDEIEFLGKSMSKEALWNKIDSEGAERFGRKPGSRPGWMTDDEWERVSTAKASRSHVSGLRSTKHPENAVRMMKPPERTAALSAFETIDGTTEKDEEIINLLKSYINELISREHIRKILPESVEGPDMTQYVDDLEDIIFTFLFTKSTFDKIQTLDPGVEISTVLSTDIFDEFENINEIHLGILVTDDDTGGVEAAYVCVPEARTDSNLVLVLEIPRDYPARDDFQDWLSEELADALSHELQHSCDSTDVLVSDDCGDESKKWESLENIEKYYGCKAEVRGHIAGVLGRARRSGKDPNDHLDFDMATIMNKAIDKGFTEDEMTPIIQHIYDKWVERLDMLS